MKYKIILLLSLFITSFVMPELMAQDEKKRTLEESAEAMTQNMKGELSLSEVQYDTCYQINLTYFKKFAELFQSDSNKLTKIFKMRAYYAEMKDEFEKVLTKSQYKKLEELMSKMMRPSK